MKSWKLAAVLAATTVSGYAIAANDGTLADPSVGDTNVTITKTSAAQITGIADALFADASNFTGDVEFTDDVCVFSSSGTYAITATGDGTASAFTLANGGNTLAYSVEWADAAGGGTDGLTATTPLTTQAGDNSDTACGGTPNASFDVIIAQADFNAAPVGAYSGVLTFSVAVE